MAFGLGSQTNTSSAGRQSSVEDPISLLNSREPPPLRFPGVRPAPAPVSSTKIPLDGLFSDEDEDNLFPSFTNTTTRRPSTPNKPVSSMEDTAALPREMSISSRLGLGDDEDNAPTRPVTAASSVPRPPSPAATPASNRPVTAASSVGGLGIRTNSDTAQAAVPLPRATVPDSTDSTTNNRGPARSTLFRNLATPPWERSTASNTAIAPIATSAPAPAPSVATNAAVTVPVPPAVHSSMDAALNDRAEAERLRRSMIFGGSGMMSTPSAQPVASVEPNAHTAFPAPGHPLTSQVDTSTNQMVGKLIRDINTAESEDHKRVASHHEFIRQQTQHAAQLQQQQAEEFLKQYLSENRRQLDIHLQRLRTGLPLNAAVAGESGVDLESNRVNLDNLEKKVDILEKRLQDREEHLRRYADQTMTLEQQHWEEMRQIREKHEEAMQRMLQTQFEYVTNMQNNHENVRSQYTEAIHSLRDALSAKSGIDAVRSTVEQSAHDFALWRTELEHKHEVAMREKDHQLQVRDNQLKDLANLIERQNQSFKLERESMQKRIDEDSKRLLKREAELEEQAYALQRDRSEFDSERNKIRNQHTKEIQRLEKRMEEVLQDKQAALENLAEERHILDSDKRRLADTIRSIEDKYALELKKKQLNLESTMEAVSAEKKLWEEKHQNLDKEIAAVRLERERLDRDKTELQERKHRLERAIDDLSKRESAAEDTLMRANRAKQEGERAFNEAKFMDEEHKMRVTKLNGFLEQLRDREMNLMRQAVETSVVGQRRANTALNLLPYRLGIAGAGMSSSGVRVQLLPNPAKDDQEAQRHWQEEKEYIDALRGAPWNSKRNS
ncbi:fas-binding factor 1 homolog isoform X2 [Paramacrobiotus metropolitanus]|nr:fas-binding factor 1 homolog isoform X2 [Paramacrobiotus metropolitanus]